MVGVASVQRKVERKGCRIGGDAGFILGRRVERVLSSCKLWEEEYTMVCKRRLHKRRRRGGMDMGGRGKWLQSGAAEPKWLQK